MSEERIVRHTIEEIRKMKDLSDWERVRTQTEDPPFDEDDFEIDWSSAVVVDPTKKTISMRVDPDIIEFFKAKGKGYQTRINAVLRMYVEAQKKAGQ